MRVDVSKSRTDIFRVEKNVEVTKVNKKWVENEMIFGLLSRSESK